MTGIDKLREIGTHKIFEQTHIAKKFLEDILSGNYSSMNRVQFSGFIQILEREYNLDLHELKDAYAETLKEDENSDEQSEPFVVTASEDESKSKYKIFYYVAGAAIAMVVIVLILKSLIHPTDSNVEEVGSKNATAQIKSELNNSTMDEARVNLTNLDAMTPKDEIKLDEEVQTQAVQTAPVKLEKFTIIPRSKLWIGMVDLDTFERTQKLTSAPFDLPADKNWALVMGHGYVSFDINDKQESFNDKGKVWFSYENGVLTKLTREEFKEKNRGKAW